MAEPMQLVSMRVPADLWQAAQTQAESEGTTVSDHIREDLVRWTNKGAEDDG